MAKVRHPLFSGDVSGAFGKKMIFRKGGVVTRMFWPRNPRSAAQQAQRELFKEFSMRGLTQEQADLLYSAIMHLHGDHYAALVHGHDHGGLSGLDDDDHAQYFNQTRGDGRYSLLSHLHDERYLQSVPQQDHGGLSGLSDDDHAQYFNQTRGDARYLQDAPSDGKYYARKNAAWAEVSANRWTLLGLVSDESVTAQTVLQNSSVLTFSVPASQKALYRGAVFYSTNSVADFKYRINVSNSGQIWTWRAHIVPGTTARVDGVDLNTIPTNSILATANGIGFLEFTGYVLAAANPSVVTFQFAQVTSNAAATLLFAGSYLEYSLF